MIIYFHRSHVTSNLVFHNSNVRLWLKPKGMGAYHGETGSI
jgi:hypothetical protein